MVNFLHGRRRMTSPIHHLHLGGSATRCRRPRAPRGLLSVALASAVLASAGCGGSSDSAVGPSPDTPAAPLAIQVVRGSGQQGTILSALPDSLVGTVRDARGAPVAGVVVDWVAVPGAGLLSPARSVSDAQGRIATRWVLGTTPGSYRVEAAASGVAAVTFAATALAARCPVPADLAPAFATLARTRARLRSGAGATIVAIGSSSTEGVGASSPSMSYPSQLARALAARFPGAPIRVLNMGISGQTAVEMVQRFPTDVFAYSPDLVIWQTGTIEATGTTELSAFLATLRTGTDQVRGRGEELLLMDSQLAPGVGESERYRTFQTAMDSFASQSGVALVPRYALMRRYVDVGLYPLATLLSSDQFHPSDLSYGCVAEYIAGGLAGE